MEKLQPYVKCGDSDKVLEPVLDESMQKSEPQEIIITTEGYESPIKFNNNKINRPKTPTNESPQYYTDMAQRNKEIDIH